jgi:outer membrane protein insertion porin family/translocation and assembly module TamA
MPIVVLLIAALAFAFTPALAQAQHAQPAKAPPANAQPAKKGKPAAKAATPKRHDGEVEVSSLSLTGVHAIKAGELKAVLVTKASSRWPWGDKRYLTQIDLDQDLLRIHAFYADRGYPRARALPPALRYSDDRRRVDIEIPIEEGEPVRIDSVSFFGFDTIPQDSFARLKRRLSLDPGDVRTQQSLLAARDRALAVLKEYGYPYADVQALEGSGSKPGTVSLTLAAEPGRTAKFGPIEIVGIRSVGEEVVRRQLAFSEGDTFKMSRVLESQRRLYNLELFQFVNFEVKDLEAQPEQVPVRAVLTEGKHRKVQFGVGYGTEDKARTQVSWRHVNFFGGARTASVEAKYSDLERGVRATFTEPYFFSPSYKLTGSLQQWYASEPAYELRTRGGRLGITREIIQRDISRRRNRKTTASIAFVDESEEYSIAEPYRSDPTLHDDFLALGLDPLTGEGHGRLVALAFDLTHDTTLNLLDARSGYLASLHVERSEKVLGGDFRYLELQLRAQHYVTIASRYVWANRIRVGALDAGMADSNLPFFKRFFLGGSTSLRGWSRFQVSPLSDSGLPIGGQSLLEGSSELRFPIKGNIGGVGFLDYGNVWADSWDYKLDTLRYDAGAGLRYTTPIGPVRFDVGYQLNPIAGLLDGGEPQNRRWRVHFSIGQAF